MNFKELGLTDNIIKAIGELGFDTPMPIQEKVIPQILNNPRDIVGLAYKIGSVSFLNSITPYTKMILPPLEKGDRGGFFRWTTS